MRRLLMRFNEDVLIQIGTACGLLPSRHYELHNTSPAAYSLTRIGPHSRTSGVSPPHTISTHVTTIDGRPKIESSIDL